MLGACYFSKRLGTYTALANSTHIHQFKNWPTAQPPDGQEYLSFSFIFRFLLFSFSSNCFLSCCFATGHQWPGSLESTAASQNARRYIGKNKDQGTEKNVIGPAPWLLRHYNDSVPSRIAASGSHFLCLKHFKFDFLLLIYGFVCNQIFVLENVCYILPGTRFPVENP